MGKIRNHEVYGSDIERELIDLLGEEGFIRLVEAFGGTRLYVPIHSERSSLGTLIGPENAALLSKRYARIFLKVPVSKTLRAIRYREAGLSNPDIATRLVITESAVEQIFRRARKTNPERGNRPPTCIDRRRRLSNENG
ncbi:hypothetical protein [Rhizobium sp. RU35A]|uniref:hypothetical protein n=1 Tax=Rhizobium sp. RU35A TaxID=1907414 RepID=UPI001FCE4F32|nr:hypothetical protein [Rhizobium sp. RU35A]